MSFTVLLSRAAAHISEVVSVLAKSGTGLATLPMSSKLMIVCSCPFPPQFQEKRRHGSPHDTSPADDGVTGWTERDHEVQP